MSLHVILRRKVVRVKYMFKLPMSDIVETLERQMKYITPVREIVSLSCKYSASPLCCVF